jgi:hypothetical protein
LQEKNGSKKQIANGGFDFVSLNPLNKDQRNRLEIANEAARRRKLEQLWWTSAAALEFPGPNGAEVLGFVVGAKLAGTLGDENARAWTAPSDRDRYRAIEGNWSSRWNGRADPTIPGDAANTWKQGHTEVKPWATVSICYSTGVMERV